MSDGAAPPPAAAAPSPAAPVATKVPVKIPVKVPAGGVVPTKLPVKVPVKAIGKVPLVQPMRPSIPKPVATPVVPAKTAAPVYKARAAIVDDEDDAELLGITKPLPVAPAPVPKHVQAKPVTVVKKEKIVVKKEKPDQSRPVQRAKRAREVEEQSSSSSSDDEEIQVLGNTYNPEDPWAEYLHHWAKRMGWLDMDTSDVQLDVDIIEAKVPKPQKISWKTDLASMLKDIDERIEKIDNQMKIKDGNKTVSLGTSKTNYIDPRIICSWCKRADVPVARVFNRSLLKKFPWALDVEEEFEF